MSTTIHYVYIVSVLENYTFTNKFLDTVKKLVKFMLPSPAVPLRSTDKALTANFASGMGPCLGTFKYLLSVIAHTQILALELRAPMGACLGQYNIQYDSS